MNLTKDITLERCIKSDYAIRHGIDNLPDAHQISNLTYLAEKIMQPLYEHYNDRLFYNSIFRCKALNDAVGSTDSSLHLIGSACDIDSNSVPLMEILSVIYNHIPFTELIAEYFDNNGWVHSGIIRGRENERKLKLKDKNHNYKVVSLKYILDIYGG